MFEDFSAKARAVVSSARMEASRRGADRIEPEHLLLGLEREEKHVTAQFLEEHPELEALRDYLNPAAAPWGKLAGRADMPLTPASREALTAASNHAAAHHKPVETRDLLRALLMVARA